MGTTNSPIKPEVAIITMFSRYISFSFSTLLVWDMLLTLKDEVRLLHVLLKLFA